MLELAVRSYLRNIQHHRLTALINILGLSLGIAIFTVLMLFVRSETSYERWLPQSANIYAVRQTLSFPGSPPQKLFSTMGGLLEAVQQDYPGTRGTRVMDSDASLHAGAETIRQPVRLVDPNFLELFPFPLIEGDPDRALARPDSVLISETLARRHFGSQSAVGRQLTVTIFGEKRPLMVTGVIAPMPSETELQTDMLARLNVERMDPATFYSWSASMLKTYLHFESSSDASAFEDRLAALVARRAVLELGADAKEQIRLDLVPLRSVHLVERKDKLAVLAVGLIAAMTLLVACINFVNLATARAVLRAREVAIRKVVGASRRSLILQFLAESLFTTIIAAVIGLTFAELLLPPLNDLLGWTLEISYFGPDGILPALVLMVLLIAVASGFYPALVLSRFAPSQVLASARTAGGGRRSALTRELLVALQFAVAVTFMIATAVIFSQTRFVGAADLGFDRSNLLLLPSFRHEQLEPARRAHFLDQAARLPGVVAVTQSDAAPGDDSFSSSAGVGRAGMVGDRPTLARTTIGDGFFQTFGVRLAAGRALGPTFGRDDQSRTSEAPGGQRHDNVLLNRAALEALGFTSPEAALGQTVEVDVESGREPATIVGVVEDIRFRSLRGPVSPTIFYYQSRDLIFPMAAIRYANMTEGEARAAVQRLWRRVAPDVPFEAISAEQNLSAYYLEDSRRSQLFLLGAAAAIFISCLGLYALASFNAARRTKEIGIRKALGAKRRDLLLLLTSQMLRPVAIAVFVAWPVAFYTMRNWLNGFEHRIELSAIYFVIAGLIALGIAAGTIAVQVLKVASVPPARALRHD